jgi:hypothetical protein
MNARGFETALTGHHIFRNIHNGVHKDLSDLLLRGLLLIIQVVFERIKKNA